MFTEREQHFIKRRVKLSGIAVRFNTSSRYVSMLLKGIRQFNSPLSLKIKAEFKNVLREMPPENEANAS